MTADSAMRSPIQISVQEFAARCQHDTSALQLIDVREPQELHLSSLEGFILFPLSQFAEWGDSILTRLDLNAETIVMCHHGVRSAQMCQWLAHNGFSDVKNLAGGIDAYSLYVDSSVPRY
ncbi:MAG: rhodanese-like domain-containing protein [Elainellaceae cyanobacterium]